MDNSKVGKLIYRLRKEKEMTQKQLADTISVSDKTISKWERGLGSPDVSLLHTLSEVLGVNIEKILTGTLTPNDSDGGNMKRVKFYVCPTCGNIITATGEAEISCCGRKLSPLIPQAADESHRLHIEPAGDEYYITFPHEMTKTHFLNFVAQLSDERLLLVRMYPEQSGELHMPIIRRSKFYFGCSRHGLWQN